MTDLENTTEGLRFERKSLRVVQGKAADWHELAKDCVCFANAAGGVIEIGVEDREHEPPPDQRIAPDLLDRVRKRIGELTVNVQVLPELRRSNKGGELVRLTVSRAVGVASTSDGRYFLRVGDECRPIVGDDVLRLADERPTTPWERMTSLGVSQDHVDTVQVGRMLAALRSSERVKQSVKEKSDAELLEHYDLMREGILTHLGVLLVGRARDRARLGTAPVVQALRYDEQGTKIGKLVWDDYSLSPPALIDAVWSEVPDFRESYELPDGMFRVQVPAYEEVVVRELLVNALVHRPYTQRGDIFLNLHPDRLEIVNTGRLPLGVTPKNILHQSRRRNDGLARVFHDLGLMEREGSGIDKIYERLLATGRAAPLVREGIDSVHVVVPRRVLQPGVVRLITDADQRFQLTQRERITLGLLAQTEGLTAIELSERLELDEEDHLRPWLGRLLDVALIATAGKTRGTRYFVPPDLLRAAGLDRRTTLARMQPHRLRALIEEDLERYPNSSRNEIHARIGTEIHQKSVSRALDELVKESKVVPTGERRWRRYSLAVPQGHQA